MDEAAPSAPAAWLPMGAADEVGGPRSFGRGARGLPRMGMRAMPDGLGLMYPKACMGLGLCKLNPCTAPS